ncbi:DUF1549 and DUF1553 domain-containing protein [Verrucomicrobiota bacterium sgz303538]
MSPHGTATKLLLLLSSALALSLPAFADSDVTFRHDVMAVVSKAGCNLGSCHGNATGKGGLKLSLRGQDPDLDWTVLVREQGGRRANLIDPERSLLLLKATAQVAHEGGQRFTKDSPEYALFLRWLKDGAEDSGIKGPQLTRLEVGGTREVLVEPEREVKLQATAIFSDGSRRDVTSLAVYEPSNSLTKASHDGLITRERAGESTVLVRYLNQQVPVTINWVPARPGWAWKSVPTNNFIDELVFKKLKTLRIQPSELCSDGVFVRRAYLDLLGMIPPADAARAFVADTTSDKRGRLIDTLLQREEFADFWALKWADLMKIEERQLDKQGMEVFHRWIRDSIAADKPFDQFARELIAARGKTFENPPANWWRANRDPVTRAENTARVFLGVQLNCAQCHNHPFERWTQDDYYGWAALFTRLDYKVGEDKRTDTNDKHEFRGDQTVLIKASGSITNPRTGEAAPARFLGGPSPKVSKERDELLELSDWLSHSPMFARMQVNRVWFHLFGRGLVDPVDDFRASNPASHPEVLEQLAEEFTSNRYSLRHVIRTIMNSRVYQLASEPNETNVEDETFHSHALVRRLTAEQIADSLAAAADAPLEIEGFPAGTRLAQVPEGRKHYKPLKTNLDRFSATFGKPPRLIASECERSNELAMPQAFQLISGPLLQDALTRKNNRLDALLSSGKHELEVVDELFWTTLSREPTTRELDRFAFRLMNSSARRKVAEDLLWALLNSKEFLFER